MVVSITLKGVSRAINEVNDDVKLMLDKANDAIHEAGFFLQSEVQSSINGERAEPMSVDTGTFKSSVQTDNSVPLETTVYSPIEYAVFLEYGTAKMAERRHFRNSAERNILKIDEFVKNAIK